MSECSSEESLCDTSEPQSVEIDEATILEAVRAAAAAREEVHIRIENMRNIIEYEL